MFSSSGLSPAVRQPTSSYLDIAGTLEKLASLRERGALTEEEFQAEKKKLLDS